MKLFLWNLVFVTAMSILSVASAQSIWTGGAGDGEWATSANWSPLGEPAGDATVNFSTNIGLPNVPTTTGDLVLTGGTIGINATASTFNSTVLTSDAGATVNLNIPAGGTVSAANVNFSSFVGDGNGAGILNLTGAGTLSYTSTTLGSAVASAAWELSTRAAARRST